MAILVIGVFIFSFLTVSGQDNLPTASAEELMKLGERLTKNKQYNKSDSLLSIAKSKFSENEQWNKWFLCISRMQKNALARNEHQPWLDSLLFFKQMLPSSQEYISYKLPYKRGKIFNNSGEIFSALKCYQESHQGFQSLKNRNFEDSKLNSYLLSNKKKLGIVFSRLGDNLAAIRYAKEAVILAKELKDTSTYLAQLNMIGKYYYHHDNNTASLKYFKRALQEGAEPSDVYPYLADTYFAMDSLDIAAQYLKHDANDKSDQNLYFSLANIYEKKHQNNEAIAARLRGINLLLSSKKDYRRTLMKEYVNYALMQKRFGNLEEAMEYVQKVLAIKYFNESPTDIYTRPPIQDGFPDIWIMEALWLKASLFNTIYGNTTDNSDLEEATFYYELLFNYFEKLKLKFYSLDAKYQMGSYGQQIYTEALSFFLGLAQKTGQKEYLEKAMSLAQRANSFVLKNEVSFRRAMQLNQVDTDKIDKYLRLAALASAQDVIQETDPIIDFDNYNAQLLKEYPSLAKYQLENSISINDIQATMDSKSILVKYHYHEDQLYRFMIGDKQMRVDHILLDSIAQSMINEIISFNAGATPWNESRYRQYAKKIYDLILGDGIALEVFKKKTHLIIVPDGPLKNLSFNSLISSVGDGPLSAEDYLINSHAISYLFYCSQLNVSGTSLDFNGNFVGFGLEYDDIFLKEIIDDYKNNNRSLGDTSRFFSLNKLNFADDEVKKVANLFGGKSFVNKQANLPKVLDEISNFSIVHFSAHALVNMEDYLESAIVFHHEKKENYLLKYSDILNLNLKSDLVVLSACQTGIGKSFEGEAQASLSKAFIQSGCKSTVSAYWEVPDQSTMKLMNLFYTSLKTGLSKAEAMQQAQLNYLRNENISMPRTRIPLHWASWAMYGDNKPISIKSNGSAGYLSWYLGIFAVLLFGWFVAPKFK